MSIASEIERISSAKADLKTAINAKGGTLTTELLNEYAAAVVALPIGSGSSTDFSVVTAEAGDVVSGKEYLNSLGVLTTGTIPVIGASSYTPTTTDQSISSGVYLGGVQTISGDANLISGNIKSGVSIFGVAGTYEGTAGSSTDFSVVTTVPGDVLSGKEFYDSTGTLVSGTIANQPTPSAAVSVDSATGLITASAIYSSGWQANTSSATATTQLTTYSGATITPTTTSTTVASQQYLTGNIVVEGDANLVAGNIVSGVSIFGVSGTYTGSGGSSTDFSGVTTIPSDVLSGKEFYDSTGTLVSGTMPSAYLDTHIVTDDGVPWTIVTTVYDDGFISAGIYDSSFTPTAQPTPTAAVSINSSTGLITASAVYSSGWQANNSSATTTSQLTTYAGGTITPTTSSQTISSQQYLTGAVVVQGDTNLVGSNIVNGVSIFGVSGTASGGGGAAETYYQCRSVNTSNTTWGGVALVPFSGSVMYANASVSSGGMAYSLLTPVVGRCYNASAAMLIEPPMVLSLAHFNNSLATVGGTNYTSSGTITYSAGKFGDAATIDVYNYIVTDVTTDLLLGDFTIDFWVYPTNADRAAPIAADTDHYIGIDSHNGHWNMWAGNGGDWTILQADWETDADGIGTIAVVPSTWTHIAMVHKGETWYLFVGGVLSKQTTASGTIGGGKILRLGIWGASNFGATCRIDELCIRNYAVWTSAFTPPISPYAPEV